MDNVSYSQAKLLPIVPETVQDQIRFWEEETKKVTVQKVNLYSDFETVTLLKSSIAYAKELQVKLRIALLSTGAQFDVRLIFGLVSREVFW